MTNRQSRPDSGLYLALISIHGLIRGHDLELGRDADTGGQTKYVVELAAALAELEGIAQVDLITRRIDAEGIDADYAEPIEPLSERSRIIRIEAGPLDEYIPKEQLWDHLDSFTDNALAFLRDQPRLPDLLHSHYADAGYVGSRLTHQLAIPLVHTGHSLGRDKRRRLLATGLKPEQIEQQYHMARRIEAEENTLAAAERVITSTRQEIDEQYGLYDHYSPEQMRVIPPGTDLTRFYPPEGDEWQQPIGQQIARFLHQPDRPLILALSRPDTRKNIRSLLIAYGESAELQAKANLLIVAGNREDIQELDPATRELFADLLYLIDRYDLYGKVAYPKHHGSEEVPTIYRLAALCRGIFINPALTEPFGLTLIEAAASGLPIVATTKGGPQDIIGNCDNGLLVDPLNTEAIAASLLEIIDEPEAWQRYADNGIAGVRHHYSWHTHAESYLKAVRPIIERTEPRTAPPPARRPMLYHDRAIFSDLDQNLLGDPDALPPFIETIQKNRKCATFGIATGRRLDSALKVLNRQGIPIPDVLITSDGTEIYYRPDLTMDRSWANHIDHQWTPHIVRRVMRDLTGIELQPRIEQSRFKISYYIDPEHAPCLDEITALLHQEELAVNTIHSFGQFLDILPIRASKGLALRYVADRWEIPLEHILVAGGSGADEDMMRGNTLAVVVGNRHNEELTQLIDAERVYFAEQPYASGILEAIDHYDFYGACTLQSPEKQGSDDG